MNKYRSEKDSIGTIKVSNQRIWGHKPKEALKTLKLGMKKCHRVNQSIRNSKKASAISNVAIGKLEKKLVKK